MGIRNTVRNAAVDQFRRRGAAERAYGAFAHELETGDTPTDDMEMGGTPVKAFGEQKGLSAVTECPAAESFSRRSAHCRLNVERERSAAKRGPSMMTSALRRLTLTTHVTSSVGWVGAVLAFLALAGLCIATQRHRLVGWARRGDCFGTTGSS